MRHSSNIFIFLCSLLAFPLQCLAFHMPLWELGFGVGALHAPLYRGSNTAQNYIIPFPFPIYRGETFRSDEKGVYSKIFDNDRLNLDISIAGNVPVPSGKVGARDGMPALDSVGEIGPELEVTLWKSNDKEYSVWLNFPFRGVLSVGDPLLKYQGWVFSPFVQFQRRVGSDRDWWRLHLSTGPIYTDSRYHDYFYEVDKQYITPTRREYHPDGGYSGSRVTLSLARYTKNFFAAAFARYDSLSGAAFDDSPLVETKRYLVSGFMFAWIFRSSNIMVEHDH